MILGIVIVLLCGVLALYYILKESDWDDYTWRSIEKGSNRRTNYEPTTFTRQN